MASAEGFLRAASPVALSSNSIQTADVCGTTAGASAPSDPSSSCCPGAWASWLLGLSLPFDGVILWRASSIALASTALASIALAHYCVSAAVSDSTWLYSILWNFLSIDEHRVSINSVTCPVFYLLLSGGWLWFAADLYTGVSFLRLSHSWRERTVIY